MVRHVVALALLVGCADRITPETGDDGVILKRPGGVATQDGAFVSLDLSAVDPSGTAVPCTDGRVQLEVTVTLPDGQVVELDPQETLLACGAEEAPDVALVLDNSGSQDTVLDATREGARALAADVLSLGGRVSVTRVSTTSQVLTPLTNDPAVLDEVFDGLFVNRGWTALWDAVRMGHETLGEALYAGPEPGSLEAFCGTRRTPSLVVFSNGVDNNSAGQQVARGDDGIDTTFDDVLGLGIDGVPTPVHTIALGRDVDRQTLADLSLASGGVHLHVAGEAWIGDAFDFVSRWIDATWRLCAELPTTSCGPATVDVEYDVKRKCNQGRGNGAEGCDPGNSNHNQPSNDEPGSPGRGGGNGNGNNGNGNNGNGNGNGNNGNGNNGNGNNGHGDVWVPVGQGHRALPLHVPCPTGDGKGRVGAVLAALDAFPEADTLIRDLVEWAHAGTGNRKVAVYWDDEADRADADRVAAALAGAGWTVTLAQEPERGLRSPDVAGYDVVWFSAPRAPMDDYASYDVLRWHESTGHGVILQGEDMGRALGGAFTPAALAGLEFSGDGVSACGVRIGEGAVYRVQVDTEQDHPVTANLGALAFDYVGDVDHTRRRGVGERVLAWATVPSVEGCDVMTPVVVVRD